MKRIFLYVYALIFIPISLISQEIEGSELHSKPSEVPEKVAAKSETADGVIAKRIEEILQSTGWFIDPQVSVSKGVVFLSGETKHKQFKEWAANLSLNTQDVTAVVNKITILEPSILDFQIIVQEIVELARKLIRSLPAIVFGAIILCVSWILARLTYRVVPLIFRNKINISLLHEVVARAAGIFVFTLGVYFIFEMADLTTMALTVISGTGLVGVVVGIAFRDITENFLASILLSLQNPFDAGDLIDIASPITGFAVTGYVERLTLRVTILLMLDGNQIQIPNATVYKSNIRNYTSHPHRREDFMIPIGLHCSLSHAVEIALQVLRENEGVSKEKEPLVLVESLTKDTANLHVYYWVNIQKHNWLKVKSCILRLIKQAFIVEKIYLLEEEPLEVREAPHTLAEGKHLCDSKREKLKAFASPAHSTEAAKNFLNTRKAPIMETR